MENQIFDLRCTEKNVLNSKVLELERHFGNYIPDFLKEGCAFLLYYFLFVLVTNKPESRNNGYFLTPQNGVS